MDSSLKALLFDMDGLMVDTERHFIACEKEIARDYGKTLTDETITRLMSRRPIESMRIFAEELGIPAGPEELLERRDRMMTERMRKDLLPMPGLMDILETFYRKKKMAVVTGNTGVFLDIVMDRLKIRKYFDLLQTSEEIQKGKPDPEIYQTAINKLGQRPGACAVLEDSGNGALAGKNAGCFVIAVPTVYSQNQDFSTADRVVKNLTDAAAMLLNFDARDAI